MIAVDTNILVYAHRPDYESEHVAARSALEALINGSGSWAVPWACLHEFLANVTNRKIYRQASSLKQAMAAADAWAQSTFFSFIGEQARHLPRLAALAERGAIHGGQFHDARIAAVCLEHGVTELWTADRDFLRFPELRVRNPLPDYSRGSP